MNLDLSLTPYTKANSKWVTDLSAKYMTFRKKNTWGKYLGSGVFIFDTRNTNHKRKKIEKLDLLRLRYFALKMLSASIKTQFF